MADLRLRVTLAGSDPSKDEATRHQRVTLVFTNISSSPCFLRGFPNVDFLRSGDYGSLSAPDTFSHDQPVTRVELAPGVAATATASFVTNGPHNVNGSHCDDVVAVRTYPPGSTVAISSGVRDAHGTTLAHFYVCGHGVVVGALRP